MPTKTKKSQLFDAAKYLDSDEATAAYLAEAQATSERATIARASGAAARARAMNGKSRTHQ